MVGEIGAFNNAIQSERTYRDNGVDAAVRQDSQREVTQQDGPVDSVALSSEAIALATNVAPVGEGSETRETSEQESTPPPPQEQRAGSIDIRV
ncbi:hypothetical protein [Desulfopila sp. IMCC35008]|uniref:hypothetical protein n=1 Tax=Desulfopila sp. IMCC35008 TaxID=2653858 RepID=UPI0013D19C9D|nr:hypothetical protein [Desulfopila sp. IMCC35008]